MLRCCLLLLVLALSFPGLAFAQDSGDGGGDSTQTWPPPGMETKPPPITLGELRSGGVFGLGMNAGSRTGLTAKIWPARAHGIVLDVGTTPFTNSVAFALSYQLHIKPIQGPVGISAQFYLGLGFRTRLLIGSAPDPDDADKTVTTVATVLGARVPLGLSFLLSGFPVELFIEAAPAVDFWQAFGFDVEGIGGARVFF